MDRRLVRSGLFYGFFTALLFALLTHIIFGWPGGILPLLARGASMFMISAGLWYIMLSWKDRR